MPRDLADVLHYFLPELDEPAGERGRLRGPATPETEAPASDTSDTSDTSDRPPSQEPEVGGNANLPLPILGIPIGERDVVRAALAWNLAVETARLGGRTVLVAPERDRGSPLWPEAGLGPLGTQVLFCPAKDLTSLIDAAAEIGRREGLRASNGGVVFVRIPPAWLVHPNTHAGSGSPDGEHPRHDALRWLLLLSSAGRRDLEGTLGLIRQILAVDPDCEIGVTLHGVSAIAEARAAYELLSQRTSQESEAVLFSYGLLVDDLHVYRAIAAQRPISVMHPQSPAARALRDVARLVYEDARSRVLG